MMGKSLELLGLASFNVFLGLVVTITFLNQNGGKPAGATHLTEAGVSSFINEMTAISLGQKPEMDQYGVTTWFMDHIDEAGKFVSTINIARPDSTEEQKVLEMDRMNYISHVLTGLKSVQDRKANVQIEYIKIEEGGKLASVIFTNTEQGSMPVSNEGGDFMIPVTGTSYCEQKIVLQDKKMKVSGATCTTNVNISNGY